MSKFILTIFVIILLVSGVYTVFSIINSDIEIATGAVLAVASFAVVLWCLSLQKKTQVKSVTTILLLISVLLISSVTLAYAGMEPFASGKDNLSLNSNRQVELSAQDNKSLIDRIKQLVPTPRPSGTYTTEVMGFKSSATFKGDTLEMNNEITGKQIYKYEISENEETITLTNVVTEKVTTDNFRYITDYQIVLIDGIQYFKE